MHLFLRLRSVLTSTSPSLPPLSLSLPWPLSLLHPPTTTSAQLLPGLSLGSPCRPAGGQQRAALCSQRPWSLSVAGRWPCPHFLSPDLRPPGGRCSHYTGAALLGMLSGARVLLSEGNIIVRHILCALIVVCYSCITIHHVECMFRLTFNRSDIERH